MLGLLEKNQSATYSTSVLFFPDSGVYFFIGQMQVGVGLKRPFKFKQVMMSFLGLSDCEV